jgi:hypothetical protein
MLRVAVLDDHPAKPAGPQRLLDSATSRRPDGGRAHAVLLDYDLARGEGKLLAGTSHQAIADTPATDRRGDAHSAPALETTHEATARDACATAPPD